MNINNLKAKNQGFTIVELLIVIVVIGILAAITIVSYSGITARANTTKALTNAANIQKVVEAYNADPANAAYPTSASTLTTYSGTAAAIAKIPSGLTVAAGAATSPVTGSNGLTTVQYVPKGTTGGCIGYWDFTGTPGLKYVFVGNATAATDSASCS